MISASAQQANHLFAGLASEVQERLLPQLEEVELRQGTVLHESGREMTHVYFPTTALVSLVYETEEGASMEFAVVGNEGLVGVELLLGGGSTPNCATVRTAGAALRVPSRAIQEEFNRPGAASQLLLRYIMALTTQVAQTAVCARRHSLNQRLCRWLLMRVDRLEDCKIVATQEQIANMLGVRREGVTEGALHLQAIGLIRYVRGHIIVLDREGLEHHACECHAAVKQEYARLLPEATKAAAPPRLTTLGRPAAMPKPRPMPAVTPIATASQKHTRPGPVVALAPPARAATAPHIAGNAREAPATHGIAPRPGTSAETIDASSAPIAKLATEPKAA